MLRIKKHIFMILFCLLLSALPTGCSISLRRYISEADRIPTGVSEDELNTVQYDDSFVDAETYYSESGTLLTVINVLTSDTIHTEAEAYKSFVARGFNQYPVTTDFSLEGDVLSDYVVSEQSYQKHPIYTSYYISDANIFWTILDINGRFFAFPASYSITSADSIQIIVSETSSLISYDGVDNRYYETIPNTDVIKIIQVSNIDSESINQLSIEELNNQ